MKHRTGRYHDAPHAPEVRHAAILTSPMSSKLTLKANMWFEAWESDNASHGDKQ